MKTIKKSIEINSPKEKVWEMLVNDNSTRVWYSEFSEGTYAETDWQQGSKVIFKDNTASGLIGKISTNKPNEVLSVEYEGIVDAGIEDYEGEIAQLVKGGHETYLLSEQDGATVLSIECDISEEYFETMSSKWDKALQKIKELSE